MSRAAVIAQYGGLCVQRTRRGEYFVHQAPYAKTGGGTPVARFSELAQALEYIERHGGRWRLRAVRPPPPPVWQSVIAAAGLTAAAVAAKLSGELVRCRVSNGYSYAVEFDAWDGDSWRVGRAWARQHFQATAPGFWEAAVAAHVKCRVRWAAAPNWERARALVAIYG